jgi:hypothetical protein
MKLYIDSAAHREWKLPPGCPAPHGVTTNPTLVLRAGLPVSLPSYLRLLAQAGDYGLPELMLQLPYADLRQGLVWLDALQAAAARAGVHVTIKLPCYADWEPLMRAVRARDVPVLLTGVANPVQLLWATQMARPTWRLIWGGWKPRGAMSGRWWPRVWPCSRRVPAYSLPA